MRGATSHPLPTVWDDCLTRKKLRAAHAKLIKSIITAVYLFSPALRQARGAGEMASHLKACTHIYTDN